MKTLYVPNKQLYKDYYCGHGYIPVFGGKMRQEGYGIGNVLGGLFRSAMPLLKNLGKKVGSQLLRGGKDVVKDIIAGKRIKSSLKKRGMERAKQFFTNEIPMEEHSYLPNRKRKRKSNTNKRNRNRPPRKRKDIFD